MIGRGKQGMQREDLSTADFTNHYARAAQRMREQAQSILNSLYTDSSYASASARAAGGAPHLLVSAAAPALRGRGARSRGRGGVGRVEHLRAADASAGMASRASPAAADVGGLIDDDEVGHFFVDGRWVGGAGGEEDYPALSPVGAGSGNASAGARVSSTAGGDESGEGTRGEGVGAAGAEAGGGGGWKSVGSRLRGTGGDFRPSPAVVCVSLSLPLLCLLCLLCRPLWSHTLRPFVWAGGHLRTLLGHMRASVHVRLRLLVRV